MAKRVVYQIPLAKGFKVRFLDGGKNPVWVLKGEYSAPFDDAIADGVLSSDDDELYIPDDIMTRLERLQSEAEAWHTQVELGL